MKNKNMLRIASIILCLALFPAMPVFAEESEYGIGEYVYSDITQPKYVDDIDEYLEQLNAGLITPINTTITTYESAITPVSQNVTTSENTIRPFGIVSDPSKSCSNIFGHRWGSWGSWYEISRVHKTSGYCISMIERRRYCTRTYCGAYQKETDTVWVTSCNH